MSGISSLKKGDNAVLLGFTGIRLTEVTITASSKTQLKCLKADGSELVFSKKTGIQTNVAEGKERYANKLVTIEDAPEQKPKAKKNAKPSPKKSNTKALKEKVVEVEPDDFDEDEDEDEFEEA